MGKYLLAVYTISTVLVSVEAENKEEAAEKFDKGDDNLSVLQIPETTYSVILEPFEKPEK